MNSTVSHEMRNPLNAIVSQVDRQEQTISKLETWNRTLQISQPEKE